MSVDALRPNVFHEIMKSSLGSQLKIVLAALIGLIAASCSEKAGTSLVGKWSHGDNTTVTFTASGSAINQENGKTETGEYSISNVTTLTLKLPGARAPMEFDVVSLTDKEMILTGHSVKTDLIKFTRVTN